MHTHFCGFQRKNFYLEKDLLTYLELQSQMTPCFSEKMKKYFFSYEIVCFYLPQKSLHLFGIGRSKRNLFFRKFEKFLKRLSVSKNTLHLFLLAEGV